MKLFALLLNSTLLIGAASPELVKISIDHPMTLYRVGGDPVTFVVCDKAMAQPLTKAFLCLNALKKPVTVVFHGCYNDRTIKGRTKISEHAYGLAIDLNADIGLPPRMVNCFLEAGFFWGGHWRPESVRDPMHFQLRAVQ